MTIAFISDLHLTPEHPSTMQHFDDFMSKSARLLDSLYILGDLFDYWVGDDASEILGYHKVELTLREVVEANTQVYFLPGNRDFLVGEDFFSRTGVQPLEDESLIELDGRQVLLMHGDRLCTDDLEYQAARVQLQNPSWQADFLARPIAERIETAKGLRAQSEEAKQEKSLDIMDVNEEAVAQTMAAHSVTTLIHGHTHRPYVHRYGSAEQEARRYVLGAWDNDHSALYYNQGKFYLKK